MFRITIFTVALLCAVPVFGSEQTVMLGVGTETLIDEIEDPDAFLAYRHRIEERRGHALGVRAELTAARPPARGALAVAALVHPVLVHQQVLQARIQHQRAVLERQENLAREHVEGIQEWGGAMVELARGFHQ